MSHEELEDSRDFFFQVRLYTLEEKSMLSFKVESEVDVPAHRAFGLLAELSRRPNWDTHYQYCFAHTQTHTHTRKHACMQARVM